MTSRTSSERLGAQLRARRRLLGLNQTEVADLAGTTQRSVSLAEAGRASGLELYASIAEVLGLAIVAAPHEQMPDGPAGGP
jgi:transcriptional regulator with XRE-family HTH domain